MTDYSRWDRTGDGMTQVYREALDTERAAHEATKEAIKRQAAAVRTMQANERYYVANAPSHRLTSSRTMMGVTLHGASLRKRERS
jgi:multidrug efflux pump subunit AcrA (membrane-fusion protein)